MLYCFRLGLELAARIASAQLVGATNGSTRVGFVPGKIELPGQWTADAVTAGATTLLMQISFPLLLFQSLSGPTNSNDPNVLNLRGGTNAGQAPQIDYTQHVFLPFFRKHFLPLCQQDTLVNPSVELEIKRRGYYPKGGGEINIRVQPLSPNQKLRAVNLVEQGRLVAIYGLAHCAGLPRVVGDGMREGAIKHIREKMEGWASETGLRISSEKDEKDSSVGLGSDKIMKSEVLVDIKVKREPNGLTRGAGSGIVVWAEFENGVIMGGSAVGKKGVDPSDVGKSAVEELFRGIEMGGCVDEVSWKYLVGRYELISVDAVDAGPDDHLYGSCGGQEHGEVWHGWLESAHKAGISGILHRREIDCLLGLRYGSPSN